MFNNPHNVIFPALLFSMISCQLHASDPIDCNHTPYLIDSIEQGNAVPDVKSTAFARRFKTAILSGYQPTVDFAGHYHVVSWGCGTECHQLAIVDIKNGDIFEVPEPAMGYHSYQPNSRLFIVHQPDHVDENDFVTTLPATGFYLWSEDKKRFKKLTKCESPATEKGKR